MKRVGIAELKSHLSEHLRAAEGGEVIEVMDRARPIARVIPMDRDESGLDVIPAERAFASVRRRRFPALRLRTTSLAALRLDRGSR